MFFLQIKREVRHRLHDSKVKPHVIALQEIRPKNCRFERLLVEYSISREEYAKSGPQNQMPIAAPNSGLFSHLFDRKLSYSNSGLFSHLLDGNLSYSNIGLFGFNLTNKHILT